MDFCLLTGKTMAAPLSYIVFEMKPDIPGRNKMTSSMNTRMNKAIEVVGELAAKNSWYLGAKNAGRLVAMELEARDLMRHMTHLGRSQELLGVRTGGLGLG